MLDSWDQRLICTLRNELLYQVSHYSHVSSCEALKKVGTKLYQEVSQEGV
jgi:hypothetical protein